VTRWPTSWWKAEAQIAELKIGAGTDCGLDMGPLVTAQHFDKVVGYIDSGVEQGATLVVDGRGLKVAGCEKASSAAPCSTTSSPA
jgi:malonate-semialdehyde dehydrogenase (acetylating)/methylmalonate-semialdehyde dehydrogenase